MVKLESKHENQCSYLIFMNSIIGGFFLNFLELIIFIG